MGYTHYWTQLRSFTSDEWGEVTDDIGKILSYTENMAGVPLADAFGDAGTRPTFDSKRIAFNGVGDDSHETAEILRNRTKAQFSNTIGTDFCKTARKPYDIAVTACLCYLASVTVSHSVISDGTGADFLAGLDLARAALPRKANILDIPMDIMRNDRWTGPWIHGTPKAYSVNFCIDGCGYVEKCRTREWYRFDSHEALGRFLLAHSVAHFRKGGSSAFGAYSRTEPNIWRATGSFDKARHARIARAQAKVLASLFPADGLHAFPPPAFARPGDMPRPENTPIFHYDLSSLIAHCDKIKIAA